MPPPDVLQIGDVITHTSSPSAAAPCSGLSPGVERQTRILHPLRSSRATARPRTRVAPLIVWVAGQWNVAGCQDRVAVPAPYPEAGRGNGRISLQLELVSRPLRRHSVRASGPHRTKGPCQSRPRKVKAGARDDETAGPASARLVACVVQRHPDESARLDDGLLQFPDLSGRSFAAYTAWPGLAPPRRIWGWRGVRRWCA
jgi:hypothetical protein